MLDDLARIRAIDAGNLLNMVDKRADQLQAAWQLSATLALPDHYKRIERMVIAAVGNAAATAELFRSVVADTLNVPLQVCRAYDLPAFVDGQATLVILLDHRGDCEEIFSALDLADARGTKIAAITAGQSLAAYAERSGAVVWPYELPAPARCAASSHLALLVGMFQRLGLIARQDEAIQEAVRLLQDAVGVYGSESPAVKNPAKRLAGQMIGRLPLIYGAGFMAAVARHWQLAIMQNAKQFALADELPEMNHTTVAALSMLPQALRFAAVCLAAPTHDHPRVVVRQELTRRLMLGEGIVPDTVTGAGASVLAQALTTLQYGDYLSCYLAVLNEVDPMPTPALDEIAAQLKAAR